MASSSAKVWASRSTPNIVNLKDAKPQHLAHTAASRNTRKPKTTSGETTLNVSSSTTSLQGASSTSSSSASITPDSPESTQRRFIPFHKNMVIGTYVQIMKGSLSGQHGVIRFVGNVGFARGKWVGVELERPLSNSDGKKRGVRYFTCPANHGIFLKAATLRPALVGPTSDTASFSSTMDSEESSLTLSNSPRGDVEGVPDHKSQARTQENQTPTTTSNSNSNSNSNVDKSKAARERLGKAAMRDKVGKSRNYEDRPAQAWPSPRENAHPTVEAVARRPETEKRVEVERSKLMLAQKKQEGVTTTSPKKPVTAAPKTTPPPSKSDVINVITITEVVDDSRTPSKESGGKGAEIGSAPSNSASPSISESDLNDLELKPPLTELKFPQQSLFESNTQYLEKRFGRSNNDSKPSKIPVRGGSSPDVTPVSSVSRNNKSKLIKDRKPTPLSRPPAQKPKPSVVQAPAAESVVKIAATAATKEEPKRPLPAKADKKKVESKKTAAPVILPPSPPPSPPPIADLIIDTPAPARVRKEEKVKPAESVIQPPSPPPTADQILDSSAPTRVQLSSFMAMFDQPAKKRNSEGETVIQPPSPPPTAQDILQDDSASRSVNLTDLFNLFDQELERRNATAPVQSQSPSQFSPRLIPLSMSTDQLYWNKKAESDYALMSDEDAANTTEPEDNRQGRQSQQKASPAVDDDKDDSDGSFEEDKDEPEVGTDPDEADNDEVDNLDDHVFVDLDQFTFGGIHQDVHQLAKPAVGVLSDMKIEDIDEEHEEEEEEEDEHDKHKNNNNNDEVDNLDDHVFVDLDQFTFGGIHQDVHHHSIAHLNATEAGNDDADEDNDARDDDDEDEKEKDKGDEADELGDLEDIAGSDDDLNFPEKRRGHVDRVSMNEIFDIFQSGLSPREMEEKGAGDETQQASKPDKKSKSHSGRVQLSSADVIDAEEDAKVTTETLQNRSSGQDNGEENDDDDDDKDPLSVLWSAEDGKLEEMMKKLTANPEWIDEVDEEGETAFHKACREGHTTIIAYLLEHYPYLLNKQSNDGQTGVLLACMGSRLETIELLIEHGVDCNVKDNLGNFPLYVAAGGCPDPINTLLALFHCTTLNFRLQDNNGDSAIDWARKAGKAEIANLMRKARVCQDEGLPFPFNGEDEKETTEEEDEDDDEEDDDDEEEEEEEAETF